MFWVIKGCTSFSKKMEKYNPKIDSLLKNRGKIETIPPQLNPSDGIDLWFYFV